MILKIIFLHLLFLIPSPSSCSSFDPLEEEHFPFNSSSISLNDDDDDEVVVRMIPKNVKQAESLERIQNKFESHLDFWTSRSFFVNKPVDVRTSRRFYEDSFKEWIARKGIKQNIIISNVTRLIEDQRREIQGLRKARVAAKRQFKQLSSNETLFDELFYFSNEEEVEGRDSPSSSSFFSNYPSYKEMFQFLSKLASSEEGKALSMKITSIGKSWEGRALQVVSFGSPSVMTGRKKKIKKPLIWLDCQFHAREWIAAPTCLYMIMKLVKSGSSKKFLNSFDFQFLPLANPDGFVFSTKPGNRMWRKTRSKRQNDCYGVDPNRNFGYHWGSGGSSKNPCSDTYKGPHAFSEPETAAVRDHLLAEAKTRDIPLYMTIHSYSQFIIIPWSYTKKLPVNYESLYSKGLAMARAIGQYSGTEYFVGQSTRTLYVASGSSDDYNLGVVGAKNAYTVEVRDTGKHGFVLRANEILPNNKEVWAGFQAMLSALMKELGGAKKRKNKNKKRRRKE